MRQPVKVMLNSLGEISRLETPADKSMEEYGYDTSVFSKDGYIAEGNFRGKKQLSLDKYILKETTVIFEDPYLGENDANSQTEDIKALKTKDLGDEVSLKNISVYDINEGMTADIVVFRERSELYSDNLFIADSVYRMKDEKGDYVRAVSGYSYGSPVMYMEKKDGVIPSNLKRGDVCRITLQNEKVCLMEKIVSLKDEPAPFINNSIGSKAVNSKWANIYGYLYARGDNYITVLTPEGYSDGKILATSLSGGNAKVTVLDLRNDKLYPGTLNDIYTDFLPNSDGTVNIGENSTRVYIYRRYDYAREIVVVIK